MPDPRTPTSDPATPAEGVMARVREIRARAEKATPGPWVHTGHGYIRPKVYEGADGPGSSPSLCRIQVWRDIQGHPHRTFFGEAETAANIDFVCAAPTDVPDLCDALETALAENATLRAEVERGKLAVKVAEADAAHNEAATKCVEAISKAGPVTRQMLSDKCMTLSTLADARAAYRASRPPVVP